MSVKNIVNLKNVFLTDDKDVVGRDRVLVKNLNLSMVIQNVNYLYKKLSNHIDGGISYNDVQSLLSEMILVNNGILDMSAIAGAGFNYFNNNEQWKANLYIVNKYGGCFHVKLLELVGNVTSIKIFKNSNVDIPNMVGCLLVLSTATTTYVHYIKKERITTSGFVVDRNNVNLLYPVTVSSGSAFFVSDNDFHSIVTVNGITYVKTLNGAFGVFAGNCAHVPIMI